jgi:hypothetical protein
MPTSATHITVVRRIAASGPPYAGLLGDPDPSLPVTDPAAIKMRFASLGACGPDFLYALMDYGPELQDLENILVKTAATFDGLADLMSGIQERVDGIVQTITLGVSTSLKETSQMLTAVIHEGLFALLASGGVNPLAFFEARRQQDRPRDEWFWADVLHYWRSGRFVESLVAEAKATGNPNLIAYANGYATHYVTDVVGHPFVNQVVGAPWRLYWQRHHLVENFIDAYVWDRWHAPVAGAAGAAEPPLDRVTAAPNPTGSGAPLTYARLNDHINIGDAFARDPVDDVVDAVAAQIKTMLATLGVAVDTEPRPPTNADAVAWSEMFVQALHRTYDGFMPRNLAQPFLLGGRPTTRRDGFPVAADIAAAYGAFRLLMRITTEERIKDPQPPNIAADISAAIAKIAADIAADLAATPPPPPMPNGGAFSVSAILAAVEQAADWAAKVAAATIKAAFDLIADTIAASGTVVADTIKYALWLVSKALYALYRSFRDVLTLRAYASPFTDQLTTSFGALAAGTLWRSPGNPPMGSGSFPREETVEQRKVVGSTYLPTTVPGTPAEMPALDFVAPYMPTTVAGPAGPVTVPAPPDAFLDGPVGPQDLFAADGPQAVALDAGGNAIGFLADPKDFGGAIANSKRAIDLASAATPATFPDYNLDGDRTYAWPCWDVSPPPVRAATGPVTAPDPLDPAANPPTMVATVTARELV